MLLHYTMYVRESSQEIESDFSPGNRVRIHIVFFLRGGFRNLAIFRFKAQDKDTNY